VFRATKNDPLYLWRPSWATGAIDHEFPIGGISSESAPRFNHDLQASELPSTAAAEAVSLALRSGWQPGTDTHTYVKPIEDSSLMLNVYIATAIDLQVLTMSFTARNA
jgi:hypothetical protein